MTALRRSVAALVRLFVDDDALAALALGWVALCALVLPLLAGPVAIAVLLFLGLAALLGFSVLRA